MRFSFVKKYLPIDQRQTIVSIEDDKAMSTLLQSDLELQEQTNLYTLKRSSGTRWTLWLIIVCLTLSNLYTLARSKAFMADKALYSPAKPAIIYKNVLWTSGVEDEITPYQGWPTQENNQLWDDLYSFAVSRIPMNEAVQLMNRTVPIPDDPGYYIIMLDVFHQLHCLNMMRKYIFWNSSMPEEQPTLKHMDHCIDSLRQSLMCSSDITPIPSAWWPKYQSVIPTAGVMHTCRDFESIQDWARERQSFKMNLKTQVEDPLGNVIHVSCDGC